MERLVTTYLEMRSPSAARRRKFATANPSRGTAGGSKVEDQKLKVEEQKQRDWHLNRDMYFAVGEKWMWVDKRPWTEQQWKDYASDPNLRTFAAYYDSAVAGYYELRRNAPSAARDQRSEVTSQMETAEVEIAYFGLLPEFIGRGLGGALLTSAIENAWTWPPTPSRVWVHTCNHDHPQALANYQARGFLVYKTDVES